MKTMLQRYRSDEQGAMTMEWVGMTAVIFIAAVLITAFVMRSADGLGGAVAGQMDNAAAQIEGEDGG